MPITLRVDVPANRPNYLQLVASNDDFMVPTKLRHRTTEAINADGIEMTCAHGKPAHGLPEHFLYTVKAPREWLIENGLCTAAFFPEGRKRFAIKFMGGGKHKELRRGRGDVWTLRCGWPTPWVTFEIAWDDIRPKAVPMRSHLRLVSCR